ncbi:CYFA0S01e09846g1_1 [Cyberlindnera fabianii]|uniref:CYFA0S01e09846g1_1 n=1 Tax=Cyberlindnera fabianii TaxID=36022 RepID=A0A061AJM8_CYBFA|nr:CYFA0S01e09846g1_1 [Cyberlindnera fabianii]
MSAGVLHQASGAFDLDSPDFHSADHPSGSYTNAHIPQENQSHFLQYVRDEFRKYHKMPKKEYTTIEYLLRTGYKRYEMFAAPEIKDIK